MLLLVQRGQLFHFFGVKVLGRLALELHLKRHTSTGPSRTFVDQFGNRRTRQIMDTFRVKEGIEETDLLRVLSFGNLGHRLLSYTFIKLALTLLEGLRFLVDGALPPLVLGVEPATEVFATLFGAAKPRLRRFHFSVCGIYAFQ